MAVPDSDSPTGGEEAPARLPAPTDDDPRPPAVPTPGRPPETGAEAALPSLTARLVAFGAILVGGACGGIIGWAITDLQCTGDCTAPTSVGALVGALTGALGVAVVAVLGLRAMGEWESLREREEADKARHARARAQARAAAERRRALPAGEDPPVS